MLLLSLSVVKSDPIWFLTASTLSRVPELNLQFSDDLGSQDVGILGLVRQSR